MAEYEMAGLYRMVACSVSDYDSDIEMEEIAQMDEDDQDYFIIEESDSLDTLRLMAIKTCIGWWESDMPNVVENCDGDTILELMDILLTKTEVLSEFGVGEVVVDVCSKNDWIRIEEV